MPTPGEFAMNTTARSPGAIPSSVKPAPSRRERSNMSPVRYQFPSKSSDSRSPSFANESSARRARLCGPTAMRSGGGEETADALREHQVPANLQLAGHEQLRSLRLAHDQAYERHEIHRERHTRRRGLTRGDRTFPIGDR